MSNQKQYNHVSATLTPVPPPPKTWSTPLYHLERYTVRRYVKVVSVKLYGIQGNEKRTESISFPLLPDVTDAELVRAAAYFSPNKWTAPISMNAKQFGGKFGSPLDENLLVALMQGTQPSASRTRSQAQVSFSAAPTVANTPVFQNQFQPPIPQPGQFQHSPSIGQASLQSADRARRFWGWYKARNAKTKVGLGCSAVIAVLLFISCISAAFGSSALVPTATPSPTQQVTRANQQVAIIPTRFVPTAKPAFRPTPTAKPTPVPVRPTVQPTPVPTQPRPTSVPTQPPQPTPCPGINCNPWGYNFTSGSLIYTPPSNFCSYFNCIPSFWEPDDPGDGYVVQCADGSFSQSGGERGACSYHGGVSRPLYSH